jgi:phage-related protein
MSLIGQSAGVLFKIDADTKDALKELMMFESQLKGSAGRSVSVFQGQIGRFDSIAKSFGSTMQSIGGSMSSFGLSLTAAFTAPLIALGTLGVRAQLDFDKVRTKITALVGDAAAANSKIIELTALANQSVGVTRTNALESFAQLKGIGGISEETINQVIKSLGKLNAAFDITDLAGFQRNLSQIFSQGFERADIKEAIGRVPFFEQLLEQAFGTKDGEKLKALKESGKLTLDSFLEGLSGAIDKDPRVANITENLATQLAKGTEKLQTALAPLGDAILKIIVPALSAVIPYVQQASEFFARLSPPIQTVIIAVVAAVAAAGPLLLILGGLVAAIGSVVAAAAPLGIAILAAIGLFIQLGQVIAVVAALWTLLYSAWQRNAGGIREITETTFNNIRAVIQNTLAAIQQFWDTHGAAILATVTAIWGRVKNVIDSVVNVVVGIISVGLNLINGNWEGAWKAFLSIVENSVRAVVAVANGLFTAINAILGRILAAIIQYGPSFISAAATWATRAAITVVGIIATLPIRLIQLIPQFIAAGSQIGAAIWRGIRSGLAGGDTVQAGMGGGMAGAGLGGEFASGDLPSTADADGGKGKGGGGKSPKKNDAERKAEEELRAQLDLQKIALDELEDKYKKVMAAVREEFKKTGDAVAFINAANAANGELADGLPSVLDTIDQLEKKLLKDPTATKLDLLFKQQQKRRKALEILGAEDVDKNNDLIAESDQKLADKIVEISNKLTADLISINNERQDAFITGEEAMWDELIDDQKGFQTEQNKLRGEATGYMTGLLDRELERTKNNLNDEYKAEKEKIEKTVKDEEAKLKLLAALDELYKQKALLSEEEFQKKKNEIIGKYSQEVTPEAKYDFGIGSSWAEFKESVLRDGSTMAERLAQIGEIGFTAFKQIADGIGQMVSAWVLYGSAGPNAMRKMVASVLAGVAAQSAVLAIFELAKGFAALFWNPPEAAAHFQAAALFGSIAVGAALTGRGVAGDAFNQQAGAATGGGASGGNSSGAAQQNNFTTPFQGYGNGDNPLARVIDRQNMILGAVEETIHQFNKKIAAFSPGEVVGIGANEASREIARAYESELGGDVRATDAFMRNTGFAR